MERRLAFRSQEVIGVRRAGGVGFMVSHPWHKNKNVPRMGHPTDWEV
jgi:hypothetical protein